MQNRLKILFLCTGNSCRSQMAEGLTNKHLNDTFEAYSAGIIKSSVNKYAQKVMAEIGIDISHHYSKNVNEVRDIDFDYVVTVCDNAKETCPYFPGSGKIAHNSFDDPPYLTKNITEEEEKLMVYRRVRDEINIFIRDLSNFLNII